MKWGGYTNSTAQKVNGLVKSVLGNKGLYYLMVIATLGLLLGAGFKWHP